MTSYIYNGIKYYNSKFKIKCYDCHYEYYLSNDNMYHIYLYNYELEDENIPFKYIDSNLEIAKKKLKKELTEIILYGEINHLIKDNYKIYINLPDVLKDCFLGVGYHVSPKNNTNSILQKGLIPNYQTEIETINASKTIDENKPTKIEKNFHRLDCVYLHPYMSNESFSQYEEYYKNNSLFAVNISTFIKNAYIASSGLGGFCMYETTEEVNLSDLKKYAKLYWKHSKKLLDYIVSPPKNSGYDFSEIIINKPIPPQYIVCLGTWDNNYVFHPTKDFKNFIKNEYKENYESILSLYP